MNNNRRNNNFTHNVLLYAVIFLCIMGIAYFFSGGSQNNGQSKTVSQTEFISELKSNKVKSFQLSQMVEFIRLLVLTVSHNLLIITLLIVLALPRNETVKLTTSKVRYYKVT